MTWILLNWAEVEHINIVLNDDCENILFDSREDAEKYAQDELNWKWKAVEVQL